MWRQGRSQPIVSNVPNAIQRQAPVALATTRELGLARCCLDEGGLYVDLVHGEPPARACLEKAPHGTQLLPFRVARGIDALIQHGFGQELLAAPGPIRKQQPRLPPRCSRGTRTAQARQGMRETALASSQVDYVRGDDDVHAVEIHLWRGCERRLPVPDARHDGGGHSVEGDVGAQIVVHVRIPLACEDPTGSSISDHPQS
mmetsp:Transcript_44138/g.89096  ORF Transcript_44138/g.89096 Transcript_44138/m.89096 type:complete len:201 (+) Transcript_44138:470-1072(+)